MMEHITEQLPPKCLLSQHALRVSGLALPASDEHGAALRLSAHIWRCVVSQLAKYQGEILHTSRPASLLLPLTLRLSLWFGMMSTLRIVSHRCPSATHRQALSSRRLPVRLSEVVSSRGGNLAPSPTRVRTTESLYKLKVHKVRTTSCACLTSQVWGTAAAPLSSHETRRRGVSLEEMGGIQSAVRIPGAEGTDERDKFGYECHPLHAS